MIISIGHGIGSIRGALVGALLVGIATALVLIAAGADIKAKDKDGKTALMLAVQGDHDEVVRVLKQAGETE